MNKAQQKKYPSLYQAHVNALLRQGKAKTTIDVYLHAICRVTEFFDLYPDRLAQDQGNRTAPTRHAKAMGRAMQTYRQWLARTEVFIALSVSRCDQ